MDGDLKVVVIAGTTREKRESIHAAKLVEEVGRGIPGLSITFVDPVDFNLPGDGNDPEGKDPRYSEITKNADAFFIVTPEYNHSFPGSLKRLLDSELQNYNHKPVAIGGASSGGWGGVRAVESLVPSVREMGLVVTSLSVYFPRVQDLFDDQGKLLDDKYRESIKRAYDELIWMAKALKQARQASAIS